MRKMSRAGRASNAALGLSFTISGRSGSGRARTHANLAPYCAPWPRGAMRERGVRGDKLSWTKTTRRLTVLLQGSAMESPKAASQRVVVAWIRRSEDEGPRPGIFAFSSHFRSSPPSRLPPVRCIL